METVVARITHVEGRGQVYLTTSRPLNAQAGQYVLAWSPRQPDTALATPLFPSDLRGEGWVASPLPGEILRWQPGDSLRLRGPLGHGFHLPSDTQHVVLAALDDDPAPLLPLVGMALAQGAAVAAFGAFPDALPAAVEVRPLGDLPDGYRWADYLALTLHPEALPRLRLSLGLHPNTYLPSHAEALLRLPMPCGGLSECGVCAVDGLHKPILVCKQGPVLPLNTLAVRE